jgi:uncharacterized protein
MNSNIKSVKRWIFLTIGLFILAFGVAFSIKGDLGTSPISSLPYVAGEISGLTVGTTTILLHCTLILLQILILRKQYDWIQLLQLPVAFIFGFMTDFSVWVLDGLTPTDYGQKWLLCGIGIVLVAIGVSFEVVAEVVTLAGEGFVLAVCKASRIKFGTMKIAFDVVLVAIACILSLIFLHGIYGVREGTVAAALLVGAISRQLNKPLGKVFPKG